MTNTGILKSLYGDKKGIQNEVEAEVKKEEINPFEEGLSDLSVTDEQANMSRGGAVNFAAIKWDYQEQKPD